MQNNGLLTPSELWGDLGLGRYLFFLKLENIEDLPFFLGSTLRGVIGLGLHKSICPFNKFNCKKCIITRACPYFQLFERQSEEKHYHTTPKGYILFPWRWEIRKFFNTTYPGFEIESKDEVVLEVTLFGDCNRFVKAIVKAIKTVEENNLRVGASGSRLYFLRWAEVLPEGKINFLSFDMESVRVSSPVELKEWLVTPSRTAKTGVVLSPIRLRFQGRYLRKISWPFLFQNLSRRLEALDVFFNRGKFVGSEKWKEIKSLFGEIRVKSETLRWWDLKRYSNRQKQKVPLGGLVGSIEFFEDISEWELDWWRCISLIHVGKGASMGLGKIIVYE